MKSGPSRVNVPLGDLLISEGTFAASMKKTIQAPRQTGRMRVGCCMQRKGWGGEEERTGKEEEEEEFIRIQRIL